MAMCRPRASRAACGISCTFWRYTRPWLVKNSRKSCVDAMNRWSTRSSSLSLAPRRPLPPRRCARYVVTGSRLMYPPAVMETTISSSAMRSSRSISPSAGMTSVRRSSEYLPRTSVSSSRITWYTRASSPRMARSSAISACSSAYSASILPASSCVSRCRRRSRMARACSSLRSKVLMSPARASSGSAAARMSAMTASMSLRAMSRPSSTWARVSARSRRNRDRRRMTSRWWSR